MSPEPPESGIRSGALANVLVVDDDVDSAEALLFLLSHAGYAVQIAFDARSASATIDDGFEPDFAVIDLGMPEVSGWELIALLKERPRLGGCRFVAITGYVLPGMAERSLAAGFSAHLTKPVDLDRLLVAFRHEVNRGLSRG